MRYCRSVPERNNASDNARIEYAEYVLYSRYMRIYRTPVFEPHLPVLSALATRLAFVACTTVLCCTPYCTDGTHSCKIEVQGVGRGCFSLFTPPLSLGIVIAVRRFLFPSDLSVVITEFIRITDKNRLDDPACTYSRIAVWCLRPHGPTRIQVPTYCSVSLRLLVSRQLPTQLL
jgi:hypothetical protein